MRVVEFCNELLGYHEGGYDSSMDHLDMTLEMIQQIEGLNSSEMETLKKTINDSLTGKKMKFVEIKGQRVQISAAAFSGNLTIVFLGVVQ